MLSLMWILMSLHLEVITSKDTRQVQPNRVSASPGERLIKTRSTKIREDLLGKVLQDFSTVIIDGKVL